MGADKSFHMTADEFRRHGREVIDWIADYLERVESFPVLSQVEPGEIRAKLPPSPPEQGEPFAAMLRDVEEVILPGITHWQSPNFFAYFPANSSGPAVLGELLSAGLGVQGMLWSTSPAATELETHVLDWLVEMLALPRRFRSDGAGGGVIEDSASSATLCALLAARERATGNAANHEGNQGRWGVYGSTQTHSSLQKAVRIAGIGDRNLHLIDVDAGFAMRPDELEAAINENTAAVAWIFGPFARHPFPLETCIEVAHRHGVPVIVDAAAEVPPFDNLTRFTKMGADMVTFSGGKGIGGPQNAGLLAGRKDLIDAAYKHSLNLHSPIAGIGRPSKVSKESLAGMVTALELFLESDHEATWASWRQQAQHVVDRLQGIPGLRVVVEDHDPNRQGPQAVIYFEHEWKGPSAAEIRDKLREGDPPIYVGGGGYRGEINVVMVNVQPGEERIIADQLETILKPRG